MTTTTSPRSFTRRRAAAVLAASALLAATVDGIGYATTGSSLVFGSNDTSTAQAAEKPAVPVGKKTLRLKTGNAGGEMPEENFRRIKLPKGHYQVSMNGLFLYDGAEPSYNVQCLVFDRRLLDDVMNPDYRKVFLIDSMFYTDGGTDNTWDGVVDQVNVMSLTKARTIIYGCGGSEDITQALPLTLHVTKLDGIDSRNGVPFNLPTARANPRTLLDRLLP